MTFIEPNRAECAQRVHIFGVTFTLLIASVLFIAPVDGPISGASTDQTAKQAAQRFRAARRVVVDFHLEPPTSSPSPEPPSSELPHIKQQKVQELPDFVRIATDMAKGVSENARKSSATVKEASKTASRCPDCLKSTSEPITTAVQEEKSPHSMKTSILAQSENEDRWEEMPVPFPDWDTGDALGGDEGFWERDETSQNEDGASRAGDQSSWEYEAPEEMGDPVRFPADNEVEMDSDNAWEEPGATSEPDWGESEGSGEVIRLHLKGSGEADEAAEEEVGTEDAFRAAEEEGQEAAGSVQIIPMEAQEPARRGPVEDPGFENQGLDESNQESLDESSQESLDALNQEGAPEAQGFAEDRQDLSDGDAADEYFLEDEEFSEGLDESADDFEEDFGEEFEADFETDVEEPGAGPQADAQELVEELDAQVEARMDALTEELEARAQENAEQQRQLETLNEELELESERLDDTFELGRNLELSRQQRVNSMGNALEQLAAIEVNLAYGESDEEAALTELQSQLDSLLVEARNQNGELETAQLMEAANALELSLQALQQGDLFRSREWLRLAAAFLMEAQNSAGSNPSPLWQMAP